VTDTATSLSEQRWRDVERQLATVLVFLAPIAALGALGVSAGIVLTGAIAHVLVWRGNLTRWSLAVPIVATWLAAVVTAPILAKHSLSNPARGLDLEFGLRIAVFFASGALLLLLILWARGLMSDRQIIIAFGLGSIVQAVLTPASWAGEPWKFAFSWPVAIVLLALAWGRRRTTLLLLAVLAAFSAASDSRSFAGFCVLALALTWWRGRAHKDRDDPRVGRTVLIAAVAGFALLQIGSWAALNGHLGQTIQLRTLVQTDGGKQSVLSSARPESAATISLLRAHPLGLGPGVIPSGEDVDIAKAGLYQANAATSGGYVDDYMFANRVELHSVVADWWVLFGPFGLLLGGLAIWAVGSGLIRRLDAGGISAAAALVAIVGLWDLAFSPIASNSSHVILAMALALQPRNATQVGRQRLAAWWSFQTTEPDSLGAPRRR
jgi:hypothetical protein